jgi:hypothetical protein
MLIRGAGGDVKAVSIKHGIIKSDRVDLTVVPCSGKLKKFEEEGDSNKADIAWYGLPAPFDLESASFPRKKIGFISDLLVPTNHAGQTKFVVYATTSDGGSTVEAIENIGKRLGSLTVDHEDIRLIEAPLLGTGKGGLGVQEAVRALAMGFASTRHPDATLRLRSFTASVIGQAELALKNAAAQSTDGIRVLVLNSTPDDQGRLRADREAALLHEQLEMISNPQRQLTVVQRFAVRLDQIQKELLKNRPSVLHFSGHGDVGVLAFEDRDGTTRLLEGNVLADIVASYGELECIVLHACYSESVAIACSPYVRTIIGSSHAIDDNTAPRFTYAFYQALAYGRSYENSFQMGRNEVATVDQAEAEKYCLVLSGK